MPRGVATLGRMSKDKKAVPDEMAEASLPIISRAGISRIHIPPYFPYLLQFYYTSRLQHVQDVRLHSSM